MSKNHDPSAFLIAVRQSDETDHTYAVLADTVTEAVKLVAACEPDGPQPHLVGTLSAYSVKRIKLKPSEALIV